MAAWGKKMAARGKKMAARGQENHPNLWKPPGLTTSLRSLATRSSSAERSQLRPAGVALQTLTGGFWNGGQAERKHKMLLGGPQQTCIFSYRPPRCRQPVCRLCSGPWRWAGGHLCYCDHWYRRNRGTGKRSDFPDVIQLDNGTARKRNPDKSGAGPLSTRTLSRLLCESNTGWALMNPPLPANLW